jgi:hypothetical protein
LLLIVRRGNHGALVSSKSDTYGEAWCVRGPADSPRRTEGLWFKPSDRTTGAVASLRAVAEVTQTDLVKFCEERVLPEVQLFFAAGRMLTRTRLNLRPRLPSLLETTVLESFALHARALIDFFFKPKRSWPHDALASDFFAPGEWEDLRPEAGPWIQLVRGATSVRLTGGQKSAARTLGIDEPLREALCAWLRHRETLALAGDWLFCNTGMTRRVYLGGQAMSYEAVAAPDDDPNCERWAGLDARACASLSSQLRRRITR